MGTSALLCRAITESANRANRVSLLFHGRFSCAFSSLQPTGTTSELPTTRSKSTSIPRINFSLYSADRGQRNEALAKGRLKQYIDDPSGNAAAKFLMCQPLQPQLEFIAAHLPRITPGE
jgi:hypothetical protein